MGWLGTGAMREVWWCVRLGRQVAAGVVVVLRLFVHVASS